MAELMGKGTNQERLAVVEGAVNRITESMEANRVEVSMQLSELAKAVADLTVAVKKPGKTKKKPGFSSPEGSDDDETDEEEESEGLDGSSRTEGLRRSKRKSGKRDHLRDCRKLQIPVFSGEDVRGWIYRVENYFEVHQFGKKDRL
ncbi:hypothetical protein OSB04_019501 [Centaurea solstitialis]|uniref:Uncharacterized protein n=1 Tax=Centaurea solstitialis TaxID=347529 RepID=A0AA38SR02_9ASTR|nr:hypothetical protein OSB04_019501 [Centaurea solstitialis]